MDRDDNRLIARFVNSTVKIGILDTGLAWRGSNMLVGISTPIVDIISAKYVIRVAFERQRSHWKMSLVFHKGAVPSKDRLIRDLGGFRDGLSRKQALAMARCLNHMLPHDVVQLCLSMCPRKKYFIQ